MQGLSSVFAQLPRPLQTGVSGVWSSSLKHLHILAQLCLLSLCSRVDERGTLVVHCTELHQQSPPSKRNNKKQALFEEGLPCIRAPSKSVYVSHFSSMLQDKQVTAPYGDVRKINNLEAFMCGAQMSNRRNTNTPISSCLTLLIRKLSSSSRGSTKTRPQYRTLTGLRTTLEFQRLGLATVSGRKDSILWRYNLQCLSALPEHETA